MGYFVFCVLPLVAFLLTLFVGRSETAPSVAEVTELIKTRINRMTSVLIAREAETAAYRESQSMITSVSPDRLRSNERGTDRPIVPGLPVQRLEAACYFFCILA
jgi:hypothetical protein